MKPSKSKNAKVASRDVDRARRCCRAVSSVLGIHLRRRRHQGEKQGQACQPNRGKNHHGRPSLIIVEQSRSPVSAGNTRFVYRNSRCCRFFRQVNCKSKSCGTTLAPGWSQRAALFRFGMRRPTPRVGAYRDEPFQGRVLYRTRGARDGADHPLVGADRMAGGSPRRNPVEASAPLANELLRLRRRQGQRNAQPGRVVAHVDAAAMQTSDGGGQRQAEA